MISFLLWMMNYSRSFQRDIPLQITMRSRSRNSKASRLLPQNTRRAAISTVFFKQYHIKPDIRYVSINEFSVLSMVEHGLGITILPGLLLRGQVGGFVCRRIRPGVSRQLGLAYASFKDLSPASRIFLEYAKDFLLDD